MGEDGKQGMIPTLHRCTRGWLESRPFQGATQCPNSYFSTLFSIFYIKTCVCNQDFYTFQELSSQSCQWFYFPY